MGLARLGRCPSQCELASRGWGDLSKPTAPANFFGVKLMFVGAVKFGQIQKITFVVVIIFRSYSYQFSVILIRSN